jgi:alkylation response protein AidB-like acyl-CoA dehydrogenase
VVENGKFLGIGGFIAIRDEDEGLRVGEREPAMGLRAIPETHLHFEDLFVADDRAVKFEQGYGKGFAALMNAYNAQRVGAATVAHGIAQGAYERAVEFAKEREQFGRPIAEFQGLQWMMADMSTGLAAAQALIYKAAMTNEGQFPDMQEAAQAKIFAAENAIKVTDNAMQIHGAMGYSRNLPMARMYRDARMFTIGGGTAQMLRNQVASSLLEMKLPQTRAGRVKLAAE